MTTDPYTPIALHVTPGLTVHELVALRDNLSGLYHSYVCGRMADATYYGDALDDLAISCGRLAQRLDIIVMILMQLGDDTPVYVQPTRALIDACVRLIELVRGAGYRFCGVEETIREVSNLLHEIAVALDA